MKKNVFAPCAMVLVLLAAGCEQIPTSIEINPSSAKFEKAEKTLTIVAKVFDADNKWIIEPELTWTSANPEIAIVDTNGTIRSKKTGKTKITVQAGEIKRDVGVEIEIWDSLKLSETAIEIKKGETKTIDVKILDEAQNPLNGAAEWKSSDESIARIDASDTVLGVNPGSATLTARAKDLTATLQVKVNPTIPPFETLECTENLVIKGSEMKKIECKAFDKDKERVIGVFPTWVSAKPEIAIVNEFGEVNGTSSGKTEITGTAGDKSVKVKVTVSGLRAAL